MAEVSALMVKELREKTGAGMMDCKKALSESQGDFGKAEEYLRKKGLSAAAKKSEIVTYPDTPHAFNADYRPSYRKDQAEDGWKRALAWFKANGVG